MEEENVWDLPKNMSEDFLYKKYLEGNPDGTKEDFNNIIEALIIGGILKEN